MELKAGQLWVIKESENCEYSQCLYIDWADEPHFNSREFVHGKCITTMHDFKYLTGNSRWRQLSKEDCYYLLVRHNELSKRCTELKQENDKAKAEAAELRDELTRVKQEKRTKRGAWVYIKNISPVFVNGGTGSSFDDGFLYIYDSDDNKIAVFKAENIIGISLGGEDVSK